MLAGTGDAFGSGLGFASASLPSVPRASSSNGRTSSNCRVPHRFFVICDILFLEVMRIDDIANVVGKSVDVLFYSQRIGVLAKQICDQIFDCYHNRRFVSDPCFPTHRQPLVEQLLGSAMPSLRRRYLSHSPLIFCHLTRSRTLSR